MYSSVLKCYYSNFSHQEIAGFCKLIIKLYLDITNILVIFYNSMFQAFGQRSAARSKRAGKKQGIMEGEGERRDQRRSLALTHTPSPGCFFFRSHLFHPNAWNRLVVSRKFVKWGLFDITNPRYNERTSPVPWHLVKSRFHCSMSSGSLQELETVQVTISPCNVRVKSIRQKFSSNR